MVQLNTILESLMTACKQSSVLPNAVTYSTIVLDSSGAHSDVTPPVIEFSIENIDRRHDRNTEIVGKEHDANGNEIGFRYAQWFDAEVTAEVFTVQKTNFNHRELEQKLRKTLYTYDKHGPDHNLPDPDQPSNPLYDVTKFSLRTVNPEQQFNLQPSVRTRNVALDVEFVHEVTSSELGVEYASAEDVEISIDVVA